MDKEVMYVANLVLAASDQQSASAILQANRSLLTPAQLCQVKEITLHKRYGMGPVKLKDFLMREIPNPELSGESALIVLERIQKHLDEKIKENDKIWEETKPRFGGGGISDDDDDRNSNRPEYNGTYRSLREQLNTMIHVARYEQKMKESNQAGEKMKDRLQGEV